MSDEGEIASPKLYKNLINASSPGPNMPKQQM